MLLLLLVMWLSGCARAEAAVLTVACDEKPFCELRPSGLVV
jgi:hypothetical protein